MKRKKSGLELEIFIGLPETQSPLGKESGAVLFLHDNPKLIIMPEESGIELKPGTHSNIAIKRKVIKRLPEPYNYCVTESNDPPVSMPYRNLFETTMNLTGFYSQNYCFELCYQNSVIKNCGCYDKNLVKYTNNNETLISCNEKFGDFDYLDDEDYLISCPNFIKESFHASDYVNKCNHSCPSECEQTIFNTLISRSKYPADFYLNNVLLKNKRLEYIFQQNGYPLTRNRLKESILSLHIYFETDYDLRLEQVPMRTLVDLVSELGENLGLYLGLSVLSTIEVIELFLKIIFILSKKAFRTFELKFQIIFNKFQIRLFTYLYSQKKKAIAQHDWIR